MIVSEPRRFNQNRQNQYNLKKGKLLKRNAKILSDNKETLNLEKKTSNLFRKRKLPNQKLDLKEFNQVLYVDRINHVAEIEGMATYEDIVRETLKQGFLPAVVPELKTITIGGALAGIGIESSSFRYGLVHETILEYELLLGDGRIVVCRPDNEHQELYYAFPNSYGTLGYALKVKVKLIPVKNYIKTTYLKFSNAKDYFRHLTELCLENQNPNSKIAFIEGVVFNKNELYIVLAEFSNIVPFVSNYKYLDIYYKSIRLRKTDYLTTSDYIWRWDPDWFWCSKNFFMEYKWLRMLVGKFALHSKVYWKIRALFNNSMLLTKIFKLIKGDVESIIQDVQVPHDKAETFLNFFENKIGIKPIWICPIMPQTNNKYSFYKMLPKTLYINFGFWDFIKTREPMGFYNRLIENKIRELGGNKSLYSTVYFDKREFWSIYDEKLYLKLKKEYDPYNKLNMLYEKCSEK